MKPTLYVVEIHTEDGMDWDIWVGNTGDYDKDHKQIFKEMLEEERMFEEDVIELYSQGSVGGYDIILKKQK